MMASIPHRIWRVGMLLCLSFSHDRTMPRRLPQLNALKAFEAAARHVSFTRAAAELCVTHRAAPKLRDADGKHLAGFRRRVAGPSAGPVRRGSSHNRAADLGDDAPCR